MQNLGVFKKDVSDVLIKYPKLSLLFDDKGLPCLKGDIGIFYDNGENSVWFKVRIEIAQNYPFCYPNVWEIGGMFPKKESFHYLDNESLCLDSRPNIILKIQKGIKIIDFIDNILIPNLAWRYCLLEGIPFDKKEYKHGVKGIIQAYKEILQIEDDRVLILCFLSVVNNKIPDRNGRPCICSKDIKYKKCHEALINNLLQIPKPVLMKDFLAIANYLKLR